MPLQPTHLPDTFPIFPLGGALLLPQGRLPLTIFEPRYLAMIEDCLAQGRYLGMVQPDKHLPAGVAGPGLYNIGCLGRITAFEEGSNGHYIITLTGVTRFATIEEIQGQNGYRRVRAELSDFSNDLAPPTSAVFPFPRQDLLDALLRYFTRAGIEANWDTIGLMKDAELLTSLCMVCPFSLEEKQALLEAKTSILRAKILKTLLEIGAFGGSSVASFSPKIN